MRVSFRTPRRLALFFGFLPSLLWLSSCGDSNRSPTSPGQADLSGTVISGTSSSGMRPLGMEVGLAGVTVRISSTGKSTATDGSGNFTLTGAPTGSIELEFERADIHARGRVTLVAGSMNTVTIVIRGSTATAVPRGHAGEEIEGLVSALDSGAGTLTVLDQRLGAVVVQTDANTLIRTGDTPIPLSQIQIGMRVHVKALEQPDGSFLATEVLLQSDRVGGNRAVSGSVVSVSSSDQTFVVQAGTGSVTVQTNGATMFKKRGSAATFSDVVVGAMVEVNGILQGDGTVLARKVTIES
jgi:hypothetical protein